MDEAWERAEPKAEHVITRYRDANQNLRTTFEKIIHRAGLKPWPKLFQNLRASRATELANEFPAHVAAAWLGHSTIIANKHYWQVTDADIARAIKPVEATAEEASDKAAQKAAHKAAQQVHAGGSKESHAKPPAHKKAPVLLGSALARETTQNWGIGQAGLEPSLVSQENQCLSHQSGAKSGARIEQAEISDPDLATVITAWPSLPRAIKAGILAMVSAAK